MEIEVGLANKERQSMLFIGGQLNFTYDDPGPRKVNLAGLSPTEKNQLVYNWRQGILSVSDENALLQAAGAVPAASNAFTTPAEKPLAGPQVPQRKKEISEVIIEKKNTLRALLDGHHATVKKCIPDLDPAQVRQLLELETAGKKRKSIIKVLEAAIQKHVEVVANQFTPGTAPNDAPTVGDPVFMSTQIEEVVESEEETVVFIPSDEELDEVDA